MTGSRSTRWARVARGLGLSAASLFVASMSHVAAGGPAPGPLALVLSSAFSLVFCMVLVGRVLSLPRVVTAVAFSQLLLHLLFSLDASGGTRMSTEHHGMVMTLSAPVASSGAVEIDAGMWIAHAIAAVLTVAVIRGGHLTARAIRALAQPFLVLVRQLLTVGIPLRPAVRAHRCSRGLLPLHSRAWSGSLSRRGPPLLSF